MSDANEEEKVVLHNRGNRAITTKFGVLPIGGSLAVPASAAKALLDYRGVVDAAKLVPQNTETIDRLKGRVAALEAENAKLRAENEQANEADKKAPDPEIQEPVPAGKKKR